MNHLSEKTLALLDLPPEERALACGRDVFLFYPSAMAAEVSVQRLLKNPRSATGTNPCMSLVGHPGLGKSSLGARWAEKSATPGTDWPGRMIYIDLIKNSSNLSIMKLFLSKLGELFYKRPLTLSYADLSKATALIRENNVVGVFIDEAPLLASILTEKGVKREIAAIKALSGPDWQINIILSGTRDDLDHLYELDGALFTRFQWREAEIKTWQNDFEGESFVKGFMYYMPLMQQSIITPELMRNLASVSETRLRVKEMVITYWPRRAVVDHLREACRLEIERGREYINANSILDAQARMLGLESADGLMERNLRIVQEVNEK
ncbi:TniB family NTP-binding protein [Pseudomonas putida]|uniref:TniB family NTP-binding protein n=1 Tax=Pseudomonas putida TaxID=303 RepID=UPI0039E15F62